MGASTTTPLSVAGSAPLASLLKQLEAADTSEGHTEVVACSNGRKCLVPSASKGAAGAGSGAPTPRLTRVSAADAAPSSAAATLRPAARGCLQLSSILRIRPGGLACSCLGWGAVAAAAVAMGWAPATSIADFIPLVSARGPPALVYLIRHGHGLAPLECCHVATAGSWRKASPPAATCASPWPGASGCVIAIAAVTTKLCAAGELGTCTANRSPQSAAP